MFSFPFVVSAAVLNERVDPASMDPENPLFQMAKDFSANVDLAVSPDYDRRLPGERWTGVDLELVNGATISAEQPNPRGDADYYPFDAADVAAKLTDLLGAEDSARIHAVVAELPVSRDAARVLGRLSLNPNQFEGAHDDD
ncbi:mmge/Prpd family protein [Arthrobacter sp. Hiyo4]|nr:mmge/Prpd family protein [Arthrobacter sp. Hiyo4]